MLLYLFFVRRNVICFLTYLIAHCHIFINKLDFSYLDERMGLFLSVNYITIKNYGNYHSIHYDIIPY